MTVRISACQTDKYTILAYLAGIVYDIGNVNIGIAGRYLIADF